MGDMNIDSLVDIPDAPDRLSSRKMNRGDCVEKESNLSVAGHVGGSNTVGEGSLDRIQGRGKLVAENGHNRNHYIHPQKLSDSVDESERWKNTIVLYPQEKARENASLFRKTAMERSRSSIREQYMDKGKAPCSKLPPKSSGFLEDHAILDITGQNIYNQIPEMAKQLNEQSQNNFKAEQNSGNVVSNGPCMTDISEIIAEDNNYGIGKGVGHPHASKEHDINFISLAGSPMSNNGEASGGITDSNIDACAEEKGGWKSTHNHSKNVDHAAGRHFSIFNHVGCQVSQQNENRVMKGDNASGGKNRTARDCLENLDATETDTVIFSKFNQISEPSHAKKMLPKRQRKHLLTSRNSDSGESSRIIPNNSDIVFLGSSRGSSSSRSSRQRLDVLDLDESSQMRGTNANYMDCVHDDDSKARARQAESDKMLARELQEQLYH